MQGRPPKSIALHKFDGTFRADRHGEREATQVSVPAKLPARPERLQGEAAAHWDRIIEHIGKTGAIGEIDAEAIEMAARYWGLWLQAAAACESDPLDRFARMSMTAYSEAWNKAAAKLGLTPVDRMRLRTAAKPEKSGVMSRRRA